MTIEKKPEDLTDHERLALAILAGCETELVWTDSHQSIIRTKYPVGIQKIHGIFRVCEYRGAKHPE